MVDVDFVLTCAVDGAHFIAVRHVSGMRRMPRVGDPVVIWPDGADSIDAKVCAIHASAVVCGIVSMTVQELAALERSGFEVSTPQAPPGDLLAVA